MNLPAIPTHIVDSHVFRIRFERGSGARPSTSKPVSGETVPARLTMTQRDSATIVHEGISDRCLT